MKYPLILLFCGVCCSAQTIPKPLEHRNVCMAPAEAELTRLGVKGAEALPDESQAWALRLDAAARAAVTEGGGALTGDLSESALAKDPETHQTLVRLREKYKAVFAQIRKKRGDVKKGRFTLGDSVTLLPCAREADFLVFLQAAGTQ